MGVVHLFIAKQTYVMQNDLSLFISQSCLCLIVNGACNVL